MTGLVARDGAIRLDLDLFTPAEAGSLLRRLLGADRADAEPDAIAELARLCGYLPLALRIAAAHLADRPGMPVGGYANELAAGDRLAALDLDGDPHASVRTALDYSYAALPGEDQRLFRLLGLVPGPDVTAPAAAALAGTDLDAAAAGLRRQARAHLLYELTPGRYAFHDLVRHYAAAQADAGEPEPDRQTALARLYEHYLNHLTSAADLLYGSVLRLPATGCAAGKRDPAATLAWLNGEYQNLIAAVHHTATHGPHPVAWRIADGLRGYLHRQMSTVDWRGVAEAALAAADADNDGYGRAAAHLSLASWHNVQGSQNEAIEHNTIALALARQAGWYDGESAALGNLGGVHLLQGRLTEAAACYRKAVTVDRHTGPPARRAVNPTNLGLIFAQPGQPRRAARQPGHATDPRRQIRSRDGEGRALANLGDAYRSLGRLDDGLAALTRALALHHEVSDRYADSFTRSTIAAVRRDAGRVAAKIEHSHDAVALGHDGGSPGRLGDTRTAIEAFQQAHTIASDAGDRFGEVAALIGLAETLPDTEGIQHATEALAIARQARYRLLEGDALTALAGTHLSRGEHKAAADFAVQAIAIHTETGHRLGLARTHLTAAQALHGLGIDHEARAHTQQAHALFTDIGVTTDADR